MLELQKRDSMVFFLMYSSPGTQDCKTAHPCDRDANCQQSHSQLSAEWDGMGGDRGQRRNKCFTSLLSFSSAILNNSVRDSFSWHMN